MAETTVKGYKVFNPDWTCRSKQYTCPGTFEENGEISVCSSGMHFCKKAADCFNYYPFTSENHVAEVIAYGEVVEDGDKCCTNKLEIVREVPWAEVLEAVNVGIGNTGCRNGGNGNSGSWNVGYGNSGNCNDGVLNAGAGNNGDCNSGSCNSGDSNTGDHNIGDGNSGSWNTGNGNSGDWNKCSYSSGCFNTVDHKIYLFDKPSEWTYRDWFESDAYDLFSQMEHRVAEWVYLRNMSEEEKAAHPDAKTTGGYLKVLSKSECANSWWRELSDGEKVVIKSIPNFDPAIFKEITGIDVEAE